MANLLSKIQIGGVLYDLKDAQARADLAQLGLDLEALEKVVADHGTESAGKFSALEKALSDHEAANVQSFKDAAAATAQALEDAKAYADAQIGAIKHFDVYVMEEGEELPTASADTMFVLYMKPDNAEAGAYIEWITIRKGNEEDGYTYVWEQIGSTVVSLTNYATIGYVDGEIDKVEKALGDHAAANVESFNGVNEAIADANEAIEGVAGDLADLIGDLGDLAYANEVTGTVPAHTVSGQKATGAATANTTVATEAVTKTVTATGEYTAEGTIAGTVVANGDVGVELSHADAQATLSRADYTPAGSVTGNLTNATFKAVTSAGTAASFQEGAFTAATLGYEAVTGNYATEGIVGTVADETLTFTAAGTAALSASKINSFDGGSKAADTFVANVPATIADHTVGMSELTFTGTKEEGLKVTEAKYSKTESAAGTFTGKTADIAATFTGTKTGVSVSGSYEDTNVKSATTTVDALTLDVSSVTIDAVTVTSK